MSMRREASPPLDEANVCRLITPFLADHGYLPVDGQIAVRRTDEGRVPTNGATGLFSFAGRRPSLDQAEFSRLYLQRRVFRVYAVLRKAAAKEP